MQDKLHRWSSRDAMARFADLFNLVVDPAFLLIAWERVSTNTGARSAGVDGLTVRSIKAADPVEDFLVLRGTRIAQLVVQRVERCAFTSVAELPASVRGLGGFGSTGG